jgi:hypothetical protein
MATAIMSLREMAAIEDVSFMSESRADGELESARRLKGIAVEVPGVDQPEWRADDW